MKACCSKRHHSGSTFQNEYDAVIAATGYRPNIPKWVERFDVTWEDERKWRVNTRYEIEIGDGSDGKLFTHTYLELSYGPAATNLGMAVYRNTVILNEVAGKTLYEIGGQKPFTTFWTKKGLGFSLAESGGNT